MPVPSYQELIDKAASVLNPKQLPGEMMAGDVGCALLTDKGNIYLGVCIDVPCSMGFCAEHSAIAAMVTHGEYKIDTIVAVCGGGEVLPPCGRCREFIRQIHADNYEQTKVILAPDKAVPLSELLPHPW